MHTRGYSGYYYSSFVDINTTPRTSCDKLCSTTKTVWPKMQSQMHHSPLPPTFVEGWSDYESVRQMPYKRLGQTDMIVSLLTFGAAHVASKASVKKNAHNGSIECITGTDDAIAAIQEAVRLGINLIDTSPFYGQGLSQLIVGKALKSVPRQAYYIATKVGRKSDLTFDYSALAVQHSVEQSLLDLGIDYIDLIQVHDVEFGDMNTILEETLPTLARLRDQNKVRHIGITGYPLTVLKEIIEKSSVRIETILSYCRHTLWDNELINYLPYFESKQLGVINAALLGMGIFSLDSNKPIPHWHPAPGEIRMACQKAARMAHQELDVHIARLALLHSIQDSRVHTHTIGMETPQMVRLNLQTLSGGITAKDRLAFEQIQTKAFATLTVKNWEGIEVERYRRDPVEFRNFLLNNNTDTNENNNNKNK